MFQIIQKRKIYFTISSLLVVASIISLAIWQLNFGIDFTGGSLLEVEFKNTDRPEPAAIKEKLASLELGNINVQPIGQQGAILRLKDIDEQTHQMILTTLQEAFVAGAETEAGKVEIKTEPIGDQTEIRPVSIDVETEGQAKIEEKRFDSIGPVIGQELKRKSLYAVFAVLIAIVLYIAWAFRKVSEPVKSWKYGVVAIVALFHDILITVGIFSVLGRFAGIEVGTPFVAALLTILGYSVNDTIVVFDRIRENLPRSRDSFEQTINQSVNETITRSINTSLTTLLVLLAIFFFGGVTIKYFVLALIIGVVCGTYSSIFVASPLLVVWERLRRR